MHDNDPELLEREKAKNLSKRQHESSTPLDSAPGWNEHLASTSEAHIKADRHTATPEEMQRSTVDYIHSRHSPDERLAPREAAYIRDEVAGPLSSASGTEDAQVSQDRVLKKHTVHEETTEVIQENTGPTPSEENVKADRGDV